MSGFIKIGHRGACGYEPENTLASFERAIELNVDMIEFDVMACKTGEIVVMHDDTVDRTTNGSGFVKDLTLKELKQLRVNAPNIVESESVVAVVGMQNISSILQKAAIDDMKTVPTLQEVLELVDRRCRVNIELKGSAVAAKVYSIIKGFINKGWQNSDFLISSFDFEEIKAFQNISNDIEIELLFDAIHMDYVGIAKLYNVKFIGLDKDMVTKEIVTSAHESNIKVLVYTVNDLDEIKFIKSLGVDGIFSNYPDRL